MLNNVQSIHKKGIVHRDLKVKINSKDLTLRCIDYMYGPYFGLHSVLYIMSDASVGGYKANAI